MSGQNCINSAWVGSIKSIMNHGVISDNRTFILADYEIPCRGAVAAWEFCYQRSTRTSVTFFPAIWIGSANNGYRLIYLSTVNYDQSEITENPCHRVEFPKEYWLTVPAGSVLGLYSNVGAQLIHSNTNPELNTYQFYGYQNRVFINNYDTIDVNYHIAIRLHLGKYCGMYMVYVTVSAKPSLLAQQLEHNL